MSENNLENNNADDDDLEDERNFEAEIENDINQQRIAEAGDVDVELIDDQQAGRLDDVQDEENSDDFIDADEDEDEEDDDEALEVFRNLIQEVNDTDEYDAVNRPEMINFDTALPASHNYLGDDFENVSAPKVVHQDDDVITVPIIALPGTQLLPGQIMPLCIYAPAQINMIKNRLDAAHNSEPTIGFIILPEVETTAGIIGILAEIISSKNEENDEAATGMGLMLKIKGRERFKVLKIRRDITGCAIADVKIMPEFVLAVNPLKQFAPNHTQNLLNIHFANDKSKCSLARAEHLNTTPHPVWLYRQYDCSYLMTSILKEINEAFGQSQLPPSHTIPTEPISFSNWLLNNFPFDDQIRLKILKLDCINQRLRFIHSNLKHYSSINCRLCRGQLCHKTDVFSMSVHGFMSAYVNPNGHVHETLTVYKAKNLTLIGRPSIEFSWFPGYAWTICQCKQCGSHIGWKFTATKPNMIPEKFWGLTRKSVCHTNDSFESASPASRLNSQVSEEEPWVPMI